MPLKIEDIIPINRRRIGSTFAYILLKHKIFLFILIFQILFTLTALNTYAEENFETWLKSYKKFALDEGVSNETIDVVFKNVKFLDQVIKYDRRQPEFFEDTKTYVEKRATSSRAKKARKLLKENKILFEDVESKFYVEKEILLALWGIETNFGKHVGKMDIISSLATLSYDKRRRDFFFITITYFIKTS